MTLPLNKRQLNTQQKFNFIQNILLRLCKKIQHCSMYTIQLRKSIFCLFSMCSFLFFSILIFKKVNKATDTPQIQIQFFTYLQHLHFDIMVQIPKSGDYGSYDLTSKAFTETKKIPNLNRLLNKREQIEDCHSASDTKQTIK